MDIHWYFWFAVKQTNIRDDQSKCIHLPETLNKKYNYNYFIYLYKCPQGPTLPLKCPYLLFIFTAFWDSEKDAFHYIPD